MRLAGHLLVDQLAIHGVGRVFCVPGESYLAVLDGLHDSAIETIVCRHESGAGMMAEATARLTGRPGIVMVTRGPGATNVSSAVHVADQDSAPLIVFVGLPPRDTDGRGAFQEIDLQGLFGGMTKWVATIREASRIPELISRAFHTALQGRPGPVVIGLPEDMLVETVDVEDARPVLPAATSCSQGEIQTFLEAVSVAKRPLIILGGSAWTPEAATSIADFARAFDIPVATQTRRQSLIDAHHSCYAGELGPRANPALLALVKDSDLVILLGGRMSEVPSQDYKLFGIPVPEQHVVHIHPGAEELGRVYQTGHGIHASPAGFAMALTARGPWNSRPLSIRTDNAHQSYLDWSERAPEMPGDLQMGAVMAHLRRALPENAVVCNGAGNYTGWVQRFHRYRTYGSQLAPISGSMGYGLPAALAAKLHEPERTVVAFAGDGCFMMNAQEFATAVQYDLPVIVIVVDNEMYGSIRMFQEREFPARVIATGLRNPDFAALARSFGGHGETVNRTEDFAPALERAMASGRPALLHCRISPEAINATTTLSAIRKAALKPHA
ncbi:MAG TPA: thiamine pyrophosphate-binding protein [Rhizobiaceae bacterium]|nr:thiamine pyrophosphate-binding protein [Rhizobiaceae bacterium]